MANQNKMLLNFFNENMGKNIKVNVYGMEFSTKIEKVETVEDTVSSNKIIDNIVLNDIFKFDVFFYDNVDWTSKFFACSNNDDYCDEIEMLEIEVLE